MWAKLLDSATVVAALSAALYFLGILNAQGDASAFGIPRQMLARGLWDTVAYGAEGLFALTLLLPWAVPGPAGMNWIPFATLLATIGAGLVVARVFRKSPHRAATVVASIYVALCVHIMLSSQAQMAGNIAAVRICRAAIAAAAAEPRRPEVDEPCRGVPLPNRVVFAKTDSEEDERTGFVMAASEKFMVMLADQGLFVLPLERVKTIETADMKKQSGRRAEASPITLQN